MTNGVFINRSIEGVLPSASLHDVKNCTKEILEKELQKREIASKYNPDLKLRIEGSEPAFAVNVVSAPVKEQNGWWRTRIKHGADFARSTLTVKGLLPYVVAFSVTILCTLVGMAMSPYVDEENFCMLYLLGVVLVACRYGRGPSFVTCLLSVIGYDFFVVSPHFTLMKPEASCIFTFIAMFVVAFMMTGLTAQVKQHARQMDVRVKERTHELAVANEALKVEVASRATAEERLKEAVEELAR